MLKIKNCMIAAALAAVITPAMAAERLDGDVVGCIAESKLDQYIYSVAKKNFAASDALLTTGQCMYLPDGASVSVIEKIGGMMHVDYRGRRVFIPAWTKMK